MAFPQGILDEAKNHAKFVKHVAGPQVCSYSKTIQGVNGKYANLNGQTVTVTINGPNTLTAQSCSILKKVSFKPINIVGAS